ADAADEPAHALELTGRCGDHEHAPDGNDMAFATPWCQLRANTVTPPFAPRRPAVSRMKTPTSSEGALDAFEVGTDHDRGGGGALAGRRGRACDDEQARQTRRCRGDLRVRAERRQVQAGVRLARVPGERGRAALE